MVETILRQDFHLSKTSIEGLISYEFAKLIVRVVILITAMED